MAVKTEASTGGGFLTALGILFIALKLTHVIHWSWWYVTLPIWGPVVLGVVLLLIFAATIVVFREN